MIVVTSKLYIDLLSRQQGNIGQNKWRGQTKKQQGAGSAAVAQMQGVQHREELQGWSN